MHEEPPPAQTRQALIHARAGVEAPKTAKPAPSRADCPSGPYRTRRLRTEKAQRRELQVNCELRTHNSELTAGTEGAAASAVPRCR